MIFMATKVCDMFTDNLNKYEIQSELGRMKDFVIKRHVIFLSVVCQVCHRL